jgi:oligoendopeptidase F
MLTVKNQPFETSNYSTFIAESASIANEMLLHDYMVERAKTKEEKLYYFGEGLESIRGTFFRQTMFAEFELAIHEEIEQDRPLSGARMTDMYCELCANTASRRRDTINPDYCVEWAFIRLFYNFYVYQYATSMAGAASCRCYREEENLQPSVSCHATGRRSGYPYELYKRAGIDMATPQPYQALVARMNRIMDEIETLRK